MHTATKKILKSPFSVLIYFLWTIFIVYCQGKQSISLEPGGQFELSGAPLETLHQTCAEVNSHLYQVDTEYTFMFKRL